ncbi:hypothetical protein [Oceanispirochaeta sp.]|uniref:hypothetical protein n=1 Tax=Oceanispirochaeta sp. TaxID=2035350 RepID=UPI002614F2DB|nr:hypothetical protein [Oceanispirochaeta sp.]MDA3956329.1 hypothetical protein [Oceanispirochaeta sp.]
MTGGTYDLYINGIEFERAVEIDAGSLTDNVSIKAVTIGNDAVGSAAPQESWFDELVIK